MTRRAPVAAAIGLAMALALAAPDAAAGARLHGEPDSRNYALSWDGSKTIVQRRQGRRWRYDVIDTRTGESRGLLERSFVSLRWGEDSDTAYARTRDGGLYRVSLAAGGASAAPIALTGERGIPAGQKPRVLVFPRPLTPALFALGAWGDRPLYRCALDPAAGEAEIGARCEIAEPRGRGTVQWLFAPGGRLAARIVLASTGEREFQAAMEDGVWRAVFRYTAKYTELAVIGVVQADNTVWALSNRGRDSVALVRLDIATGAEEAVYRRRRLDIDRAFLRFDAAGKGAPLLAVHFPGYQEIVHFEPRLEAAYAALRARLGGRLRIDFRTADRALKYAIVEARSPRIHRRWYLLDLDSGSSRALSAATLAGYDRPAAPSRPVRFAASDGLMLHGYLTLPRRREAAGPPPMVLMLHGGPWSRDRWPAPPLVRFLGSRGYAVLRLNYRGSIGYGRDFLEAGKGSLSGRLQADVRDAARWAVAEGHAAEGRIALFGGSFGGLLALAVLARHPHGFRAGIALNAPADAVAFWKRDWPNAGRRAVWRAFLASRDLPEAALARISPVNNFRRFDAPVLLLAGARDRRVPPEQSYELFDLLRAAGKTAELVEYRGAGHNLPGAGPETREHIAGAIADFLAEYLPAGPR